MQLNKICCLVSKDHEQQREGRSQRHYKDVVPSTHLHICIESRVEAVAAAAGLAALVCARRHGEPRSEQTGQAASTLQLGTLLVVTV